MKLFRVAGIDVRADWSLLIIFFLIFVSLGAGLFPAWHPSWAPTLVWLTALAAAILFFASVLLHELSHALVGRRNGVDVKRITLFVFGGMAEMETEPDRWRAELWMTVVGPLTSLAIGFLCLVWVGTRVEIGEAVAIEEAQRLLAQLGPVETLLLWLGQVNLVLAIFNLVPGFPLDGGRILRALLWGATGDIVRATRWASTLGQAFAWVLIGMGLAMILGVPVPFFGGGPVNGIWLAFIGWFLNRAAVVSYAQLITREALQDVPVDRLMLTRFDAIDPDSSVQSLIEDHALRSGQRAFPVVENERLVGLVCLQDLISLEPERRNALRARDIMKPAHELSTVQPGDDAFDALRLLGKRKVGQLPVVEQGRIMGIVRREDILRWLTLHGALRGRSEVTHS